MKIFKTFGLFSALALGSIASSVVASAAPAGEYIQVHVPFAFVLSGKVFPAGTYSVQETSAGVIMVQGGGKAALALTIPVSPVKAGSVPAVRFTASNGREYLVSIDDDTVTHAVSTHNFETRTLTLSH